MSEVLVCPVAYNENVKLKSVIGRFLKSPVYGEVDYLIVDDGSNDGTQQIVKETYPEVEILSGDGNLWWTGAMHLGVEYILGYAKWSDFNAWDFSEPAYINPLIGKEKMQKLLKKA